QWQLPDLRKDLGVLCGMTVPNIQRAPAKYYFGRACEKTANDWSSCAKQTSTLLRRETQRRRFTVCGPINGDRLKRPARSGAGKKKKAPRIGGAEAVCVNDAVRAGFFSMSCLHIKAILLI
ncbi:uncharacterized protein TRIREDRAFT_104577, partial [Trichoderma reesei QM6a]